MRVIATVEELRTALSVTARAVSVAAREAVPAAARDAAPAAAREGRRGTGLVPTMGYLHDGHTSLVRRARQDCDLLVVSLFVNPTQFGPGEDFASYPRDLPRDLELLEREGVDVAFAPPPDGLYPPGADTVVRPGRVAEPLEGAHRPGHFEGVATVVTMLLSAVQPRVAYFGEKDWQQLQVVRRVVRDLLLPVEVVGLPVVREADGLALSSRNVRLSTEDRRHALCVPRAIEAAREAFAAGESDPAVLERAMARALAREPAVETDYAVVADAETLQPQLRATAASRALVAARVGGVRLIDNAPLAEASDTPAPGR